MYQISFFWIINEFVAALASVPVDRINYRPPLIHPLQSGGWRQTAESSVAGPVQPLPALYRARRLIITALYYERNVILSSSFLIVSANKNPAPPIGYCNQNCVRISRLSYACCISSPYSINSSTTQITKLIILKPYRASWEKIKFKNLIFFF